MNKRSYLAVALVTVTIGIGAAGVGTASASPANGTARTSFVASPKASGATDGDNVQQGDQTGPDGTDVPHGPTVSAPVSRAAVTAVAVPAPVRRIAVPASVRRIAVPAVAVPVVRAAPRAGTQETDAPETGTSDGPGGWEDPAGSNADTQQEGEH